MAEECDQDFARPRGLSESEIEDAFPAEVTIARMRHFVRDPDDRDNALGLGAMMRRYTSEIAALLRMNFSTRRSR